MSDLRTIPQAPEAEKAVLSAMMQDPKGCIPRVQSGLTEEAFYSDGRRLVFRALCDLWNADSPVEPLTLITHLRNRPLSGPIPANPDAPASSSQLDAAGGPAEIAEIATFIPAPSHLKHYLGLVRKAWMQRQVITTAQEIGEEAFGEVEDLAAFLASAEHRILALGRDRALAGQDRPRKLGECLQDAISQMEQWATGDTGAIPSGFTELDAKLDGGFRTHSYTVIAARPSLGKTTLGTNMLVNIARSGIPTACLSLETKAVNLTLRSISAVADVHFSEMRRGTLSGRDFPRVQKAVDSLKDLPFWFYDPGVMNCNGLRHMVRSLHTEHGVVVFMVDYLQLVTASTKAGQQTEYAAVTEVSRTLKELSQSLPIVILAIAQVNREAEGGRVTMKHLRSSGQIEQDATEILLLSEDESGGTEEEDIHLIVTVAKQKDGAKGDVRLRFNRPTFSFHNANITCP